MVMLSGTWEISSVGLAANPMPALHNRVTVKASLTPGILQRAGYLINEAR